MGTTFNINLTNQKRILLAGPWVGEFGWELFCWQGHVRKLSKEFDETIILGRKGHSFLYSDFTKKFFEFNSPAIKANMWLGELDENKLRGIVNSISHTQHLRPFNIGFGIISGGFNQSNLFKSQIYFKYKSDTINKCYDIILHPRNKVVGSNRNWKKENWQRLVNLLVDNGLTVAIIGTEEAFKLKNTGDYRNISIEDTVSLINRCKLVVGTSSGPMHLASLCGVQHLVWSDNTNKLRYESVWNPFNTKVYFYDKEGWNPDVNNIYNMIKEKVR